nr:hypothetical protein [Chitinibacter sp. ZOR0017]
MTGIVYNGSHPAPTFSGAGALPANKTLSGIKSKEYKGGRSEVNRYLKQLTDLRKMAAGKIDNAVAELKKMHGKLFADDLPKGTAKSTEVRAKPEVPVANKSNSGAIKKDKTPEHPATPKQTKTNEHREAKKKSNWHTGVLPEHLTDYYMPSAKIGFKKINDNGRKREEHDGPKGAGIDHIWHSPMRSPTQPYVIGETKGSLLDSFALLAALPAAQREQLEQMKSEDPFDPAPQDRKTPSKVTVSEDANEGDLKAKRQGKKVEQGLSTTKTRGVQMSHQWVVFNILNTESKGLAKSHKATLLKSIGQFDKRVEVQENPQAPYDRWIIMVTGKQKVRHEVRHGHHHEIRRPMVELPNNILWK